MYRSGVDIISDRFASTTSTRTRVALSSTSKPQPQNEHFCGGLAAPRAALHASYAASCCFRRFFCSFLRAACFFAFAIFFPFAVAAAAASATSAVASAAATAAPAATAFSTSSRRTLARVAFLHAFLCPPHAAC